VLNDADLRGFDRLASLTLKGYNQINFADGVNVGADTLGQLVLDTPRLRAEMPAGNAAVAARTVTLRNSGSVAAPVAANPAATGSLTVDAGAIVLGGGSKAIDGFGRVALRTDGDFVTSGIGSLRSGANTLVQAARIVGTPGSDQALIAGTGVAGSPGFDLSLAPPSIAAGGAAPSLGGGGRLALEGKSVHNDTLISMKSGIVNIAATGASPSDGVSLGANGSIDVGAYSRSFAGQLQTADAGSVSLTAAAGGIAADAGSRLLLGGGETAGDAGRLELNARAVQLGGTIVARANPAAQQGQVAVSVQSLPDFSALNQTLESAGFTAQRSLRVRQGDIHVAQTDTVTARNVQLQADAGRVVVDGRIDASSANGGGRIELHAGTGISLNGQLDASGTSLADASARPSNGGTFSADVRGGTLAFGAGAAVDVRPGAKGEPGRAEFTAQRLAGNTIDVDLQGTVLTRRAAAGPVGEVVVQGRRVIAGVVEPTAQDIQNWSSEHAAFMAGVDANAVLGSVKGDAGKHVRGALELQTTGDFTLGTDWDLSTANWLAGPGTNAKEAGTLSVRAAGDITIRRSLGLPDDKLVDAPTWSLQLAAGADLGAADSLALQSSAALGAKGNLRMAAADAALKVDQLDPGGSPVLDPLTGEVTQVEVDQAAKIRTGSGSISIVAGRDFVFEAGSLPAQDAKRVIYTAGRPTALGDTSAFTVGIDSPWADGGGDVTIHAQRNAIGNSNQAVNGWLRRPRVTFEESIVGGWFVHRPNFQQDVGALGGGDVRISAGNDVLNLSAAVPTMGRIVAGANGQALEVTGGGDLNVQAGNRIEGGDYLLGRGAGQLRAGSSIGASTPTQVFLMGESNDPGRSGATMQVSGRSGVRLQSIDNPTVLALPQSRARGPAAFVPELDAQGNPISNPDTGLPFYLPLPAQNFLGDSRSGVNFYTYAPTTSITVHSLGGDIALGARPLDKPALAAEGPLANNAPMTVGSAYPGIVNAVAFGGAISGVVSGAIGGSSALPPTIPVFPARNSALGLYAATDISRINLAVSDRALSGLPSWDRPTLASDVPVVASGGPRLAMAPASTAYRYDLVADSGSIRDVRLNVPDRARVQAGLDITGASLELQNQKPSDVSLVRAIEGDIRPNSLNIAGPGALQVQAGRNFDAGTNPIQALGSARNPSLATSASARMVFIVGVKGDVDIGKLDAAFAEFGELNKRLNDALALYRLLNAEGDLQRVLRATSVVELARQNPAYERFVELDRQFPSILATYQRDLRGARLPLGPTPAASRAADMYALLNAEQDDARVQRILAARSLTELAADPGFTANYAGFAELDQLFPTLFSDYRVRRANGFTPSSVLPIVFAGVLDDSVAKVFPGASVTRGNFDSFLTSIQSVSGSGIDLIAPAGDITVGLTTPRPGREVGITTTAGGDIRSYLSGNFNINQGKVVTAQGGDILIFTSRGNIDAGRGARTSQTSPAPVRVPDVDANGVVVGFTSRIPPGFSGSGIQTLSSDPDGQGPLPAARAGAVSLFTPSGFVDAGEAGIVSGGNLVIVAQTVLNAANISAGGSSVGVPVAVSGSLASGVAAGGGTGAAGSKAAEDASSAASNAAKAAAAAVVAKPSILTVEVLGFGDKNCKEQDKDCFAK
jgi:filamentous hemagglutinin